MGTAMVSQSSERRSGVRSRRVGAVYLSFLLDEQTPALISTQHSHEVMDISADQITAMPAMAAGILGLFNHRGHIFWIVDLPQTLGLEPLAVDIDTYSVIVLRVPVQPSERVATTLLQSDYVLMGFAIHQMRGSVRLSEDLLQPAMEQFSSTLAPCLAGLVMHQQELCLVLKAEAIAQASVLGC
jgi:chemotaxis signal transduction protein